MPLLCACEILSGLRQDGFVRLLIISRSFHQSQGQRSFTLAPAVNNISVQAFDVVKKLLIRLMGLDQADSFRILCSWSPVQESTKAASEPQLEVLNQTAQTIRIGL